MRFQNEGGCDVRLDRPFDDELFFFVLFSCIFLSDVIQTSLFNYHCTDSIIVYTSSNPSFQFFRAKDQREEDGICFLLLGFTLQQILVVLGFLVVPCKAVPK